MQFLVSNIGHAERPMELILVAFIRFILSPRMIVSLFCGTYLSILTGPQQLMGNKKDKTFLLIDMTAPLDTNSSAKITEKLTTYKDGPVVMGALDTVKNDIENYSNNSSYSSPSQASPLHQVETL